MGEAYRGRGLITMNRSDLAIFFWELGLKFQAKFRMDRKIDFVYPISIVLDYIGNFIEYGVFRSGGVDS